MNKLQLFLFVVCTLAAFNVTGQPGAYVGTNQIRDDAVTLPKIANQANNTILGNDDGVSSSPQALTSQEALTVVGPVAAGGYAPSIPSIGFFSNVASGVRVYPIKDRMLVGAAADTNAGSPITGLPTNLQASASYLIRDASLGVVNGNGAIGVGAMVESGLNTLTPVRSAIALGGLAISNLPTYSAWGGYLECQAESTGNGCFGLELDTKNKTGVNVIPTPYNTGVKAVHGVWNVAGGDASYGGSPTNPSGAAFLTIANSSTWNVGLVFAATSITGTDGLTGTGTAIALAKGHGQTWSFQGAEQFTLRSDSGTAGQYQRMLAGVRNIDFTGNDDKTFFKLNSANSANNNHLEISSASTGVSPPLTAAGDDTDVGIRLVNKGAGRVVTNALSVSGNVSAAATTTAGIGLSIPASTYTDTTSSGVVATTVAHGIAAPTLSASSATTYTQAATVYIAGAPNAGTNVTISSGRALLVAAGNSRFDGSVTATGGTTITNGATVTGATTINANNNSTTGLCTGTCNAATSIGGGSGTVAIDSSDWDITTVGVVSGINSIALTDGLYVSATDPTVASGFGTSPSIVANGTSAFTIDVGTGGTATGGVFTMPTATTGWICSVANRTGQAANRADQATRQTATTTTTVTIQNQTLSTGAALAWTASDIVQLACSGY